MQRLLGFVPLLVAWTLVPVNLTYGATVFTIGRLSDRISPRLLVVLGLVVYATIFFIYAGINELATVAMMITLLSFRFIAERFVGSPNNLIAIRALPEGQVMMASGLLDLLRSIAGTLGPALAAVFWDQRYGHHIQRYAENTPADALGLTTAISGVQHLLLWTGEVTTQFHPKPCPCCIDGCWRRPVRRRGKIISCSTSPAPFCVSSLPCGPQGAPAHLCRPQPLKPRR